MEIIRGFRESAECIRGDTNPNQWCDDFQTMLREHAILNDDTIAFRLGATFGFSFRAESEAEGASTSSEELRWVAEHAALARVDFEHAKSVLNLTDSDIAQLLQIGRRRFSNWKMRLVTSDRDTSGTCIQPGIEL